VQATRAHVIGPAGDLGDGDARPEEIGGPTASFGGEQAHGEHGTTRIIGERKVWSWFSDCGGKGASRR
jgi:hypothetical protein